MSHMPLLALFVSLDDLFQRLLGWQDQDGTAQQRAGADMCK